MRLCGSTCFFSPHLQGPLRWEGKPGAHISLSCPICKMEIMLPGPLPTTRGSSWPWMWLEQWGCAPRVLQSPGGGRTRRSRLGVTGLGRLWRPRIWPRQASSEGLSCVMVGDFQPAPSLSPKRTRNWHSPFPSRAHTGASGGHRQRRRNTASMCLH